MDLLRRMLAYVVGGAVVATAALTVTALPAQATVTTICTGYAGCASHGYSTAGYSAHSSTSYWRMYSGHNCTNYAAYRMVLAGLPNTRPWSGDGNATNWGTAESSITNATPAVGAIAWWKANVNPAGSAGHVAYVERVVSASEIIVSQDSWGGDFSWAVVTRTTKGWPSGFIHFKDVGSSTPPTPTPTPTPTPAPTPTPTPAATPPSITGSPLVGSTLTTAPGAGARLASTSTVAYQWLENGKPVSGATGSSYLLGIADVGDRLQAVISVATPGSATQVLTTAATDVVRAPTALRVLTRPGHHRLGITATLSAAGMPPVAGVLQVRSRGRLLRQLTVTAGTVSTTLTDLRRGARRFAFTFVATPTLTSATVTRRLRIH